MNKVILVIVFMLTLAGCAKQQDLTQKNESVVPVGEVKQIEPTVEPAVPAKAEETVKEEVGIVEEKTIDMASEVTAAADESGFQVAPPAGIVEKMQAQVKEAQEQKVAVTPVAGVDEVIAKNGWGFSVYDPKTGIEEFYTSKGSLLGSKKRL